MIGDQFVASRSEVNAPTGSCNGIGIVGYDQGRAEFTFTTPVDSMRMLFCGCDA